MAFYLSDGPLAEAVYKFFLMYLTPFLYALIFFLVIILFYKNFKTLRESFSKIDKRVYLALFLIFLVGLWLRFPNLESDGRTTYSTWEYFLGGKFLALTGSLQRCDFGSFFDCPEPSSISHPAGLSIILAGLFIIFGVSPSVMLYLELVLSLLTIVTVFFLAYLLTKKQTVSLLASVFMTVSLLHIVMTHTADGALAVTSVFFSSLYFIFLLHALEQKTRKSYALASFSFVLLLTFRMENLMYIPITILLYFHSSGFTKMAFMKLMHFVFDNLDIVLITIILSVIPLAVFFEHWIFGGLAPSMFSMSNFYGNIPRITHIFSFVILGSAAYLFISSVLFLLCSRKTRRLSLVLLSWFFISPTIFMLFSVGPSPRYLMPTCIPLALLFALGMHRMSTFFEKNRNLVLIAVSFLIISISWLAPPYMSQGNMHSLIEAVDEVPVGAVVLLPSVNTVWAVMSVDSEVRITGFLRIHRIQTTDNLYFIKTDTCELTLREYADFCDFLSSVGTPVANYGPNTLFEIGHLSQKEIEALLELYERHGTKL